jgi:uncharacterized SAM-dependent methyltransferase
VSAYDDVWSGAALKALSLLPPHIQDQVDALVREICRNPQYTPARIQAGHMVASAGPVAVMFEVALVDNLVRVAGVQWTG